MIPAVDNAREKSCVPDNLLLEDKARKDEARRMNWLVGKNMGSENTHTLTVGETMFATDPVTRMNGGRCTRASVLTALEYAL